MNIGDTVPDFEATLHDGTKARLSDYTAAGPVVLFFYPKAHTGGCTAEGCHFRDLKADFEQVGAQRIGVSGDDVETQASFAASNRFDYPLIADTDRSIAKLMGAKRPGPLWNRRTTYVIGRDRTLLAVLKSETDMEMHADQALELLRR